MNELSFLQKVARGPLMWDRSDDNFVIAQWLRDALHARGYLQLGTSQRIDASAEGELNFCVLGLTPEGKAYLATLLNPTENSRRAISVCSNTHNQKANF